jgi:hypothetical protein
MGRPTILTDDIRDKLCALIAQGLPKTKACWLVGIDERTMYQWIEQGSANDAVEPYLSFAHALKKAEADATVYFFGEIKDAKAGDWQKWARIWEGLQPDVFARMPAYRVEVTGANGGPIESVSGIMGVSDAEIERLASGKGKRKST